MRRKRTRRLLSAAPNNYRCNADVPVLRFAQMLEKGILEFFAGCGLGQFGQRLEDAMFGIVHVLKFGNEQMFECFHIFYFY